MPLLSTQLVVGLTYLCTNVAGNPQYNQACNKSVEAGTKQVGTYQLLEDGEKRTMEYATGLGEDKLGTTVMKAGAAGVYAYRVYRDKSVTFKIKSVGIADSMTNQVTTNSYKLSLDWHF